MDFDMRMPNFHMFIWCKTISDSIIMYIDWNSTIYGGINQVNITKYHYYWKQGRDQQIINECIIGSLVMYTVYHLIKLDKNNIQQ